VVISVAMSAAALVLHTYKKEPVKTQPVWCEHIFDLKAL
jgi:hypothetical protein